MSAGKRVVQVLGRLPHDGGALVDQPLGDEARVEVHVLAHGVVAHVLDAAGDGQIAGAHRDLARRRGGRGQRARAHPVDGEARHRVREAGKEADVAAEGQALVAHLGGGGHDDVADPLRRCFRVPAEELADDLDAHVVGAGLPEEAAGPGLAERRADAVDVHDLLQLARHVGGA